MAVERHAEVTWNGGLMDGVGPDRLDRAAARSPGSTVTWASRSEPDESGRTSPEELIAAAHATCFSMALSFGLANAGTPPEQLNTSATVSFQPGEGITKIALAVEGRVPGLDEDGFKAAAEGAKANCPVSKALTGVPEITLDARLQT